MNILVTGARGFIGSKLVNKLKNAGHNVAEFNGNITNVENVKEEVKNADVVYHLAAELDEAVGEKKMFNVNVKGTENLLEAAAKARVKKFIHMSSVGVMGNVNSTADENTPCNPQTLYEKSKYEAEKLVMSYQELLPVTAVRGAIVYGANEYWRKIVKRAKNNFPLAGKCDKVWQMIYVDDIVDALFFVLKKDETIGEVYIVADEQKYSFNDVYKELMKNLGMKQEPRHIPVFLAYIVAYGFLLKSLITGKKSIVLPQHVARLTRERRYNISKIKKLGWAPKTSLQLGMKRMFSEMKNK